MTDINFSQPHQASTNPAIQQGARAIQMLRMRLNEVLIGQQQVVDEVLTVFLAGGHVLLEGVPGTGKTLLVRSLAQSCAKARCSPTCCSPTKSTAPRPKPNPPYSK